MDKTKGFNKLALTFQGQMSKTSKSPLPLDFGIIEEDYSLRTDTFPVSIPVSDYLICRGVSWNPAKPMTMTCWEGEGSGLEGWEEEDWSDKGWKGGEDLHNPPLAAVPHEHDKKGAHDHGLCSKGIHYHDVYLPDKMRWIKPGDRVLVAWVGEHAVVVDIIVSAKVVTE